MRILITGHNPLSLFFSSILSESMEIVLYSEKERFPKIREGRGAILESRVSEHKFDVDAVTSNLLDLVGEKFDAILFTGGPAKVYERLKAFSENSITTSFYILNCDGLLIEEKIENLIPKHSFVARFITDVQVNYDPNSNILRVLKEEDIYVGYTIKGKISLDPLSKFFEVIKEKYSRVQYLENMKEFIWRRGIIIASALSLSAILGVKMRYLLESIEARELLQNLIREGERIARKRGLAISNLYREVLMYIKKHGEREISLLSQEGGYSPDDIEFLNGAILNVSKKFGVNSVYNEIIYKLLKARESIRKIG
ncbi:MAG: ketopantoate reductase C-terminal domain-containing protein [Candidatus Njordarchaeia archaeon]